jgi:hypothetical protein
MPETTTARTRKRCPQCGKMIEAGETVIATDDRHTVERQRFYVPGRGEYQRGAWHLWHPECKVERERYEREAAERSERERAAELADMRAAIAGYENAAAAEVELAAMTDGELYWAVQHSHTRFDKETGHVKERLAMLTREQDRRHNRAIAEGRHQSFEINPNERPTFETLHDEHVGDWHAPGEAR